MAKSVHLKEKLQIAGEAFGTNGVKALFDLLYDDYEEPEEDALSGRSIGRRRPKRESLFDRFSRQYDGRIETTRDLDLFQRIGTQFDILTPDKTLLECTAAEFFNFIPNKYKEAVRARVERPENAWLKEIVDAASTRESDDDEVEEEFDQVIYRSLTHNFADRSDVWQETGVVDQKFMYLNLHSVENWRALLDDRTYRPYLRCISALEDLLIKNESPWQKESASIDIVVIFGAGTPNKEILIIKNLLRQKRFNEKNKLRVVIVDASVYMLVDTYVQIRKLLEREHLNRKVDIVQCWADFNRMKPHLPRIRDESGRGRVAFFLMGGTIGNIDEGRFLGSVHDVSEPNDLLVVGAEFVPDKAPDRDAYLEEFIKDYSGDHARDLVLEPIRRLLDLKGVDGDIVERRSMVTPTLVEHDPNLGPIYGTVGVVLRFDRWGLNLALSKSKRYNYEAFTEFFERRHFKLTATFPCAEFDPYQQVMFVREAT